MRPRTETASLVNHLDSRAVIGQPVPVVGMGATLLSWTDRHAATITKVEHLPKEPSFSELWRIEVCQDIATVIAGSAHDGSAEYAFRRDERASPLTFQSGPNGRWKQVRKSARGRWCAVDGYGLRIGEREEYRYPCF